MQRRQPTGKELWGLSLRYAETAICLAESTGSGMTFKRGRYKKWQAYGGPTEEEVRRSILFSVLELDRPVAELQSVLAPLSWDYPEPLVTLTYTHIRSVLLRFLAGKLNAKDVEAWADLVELRNDIEFADERTLEVIHMLSTPQSTLPLMGDLRNGFSRQIQAKHFQKRDRLLCDGSYAIGFDMVLIAPTTRHRGGFLFQLSAPSLSGS